MTAGPQPERPSWGRALIGCHPLGHSPALWSGPCDAFCLRPSTTATPRITEPSLTVSGIHHPSSADLAPSCIPFPASHRVGLGHCVTFLWRIQPMSLRGPPAQRCLTAAVVAMAFGVCLPDLPNFLCPGQCLAQEALPSILTGLSLQSLGLDGHYQDIPGPGGDTGEQRWAQVLCGRTSGEASPRRSICPETCRERGANQRLPQKVATKVPAAGKLQGGPWLQGWGGKAGARVQAERQVPTSGRSSMFCKQGRGLAMSSHHGRMVAGLRAARGMSERCPWCVCWAMGP